MLSVRTPARLDYVFTAGQATTRFLPASPRSKILGERARAARSTCRPAARTRPRRAHERAGRAAPRRHRHHFCVVNVAFYGQAMEIPYVTALILLDGSDLPIMHLLQEVATDDVRIGMRVEAVWVIPTTRSGPEPSRASSSSVRPASPTPR